MPRVAHRLLFTVWSLYRTSDPHPAPALLLQVAVAVMQSFSHQLVMASDAERVAAVFAGKAQGALPMQQALHKEVATEMIHDCEPVVLLHICSPAANEAGCWCPGSARSPVTHVNCRCR